MFYHYVTVGCFPIPVVYIYIIQLKHQPIIKTHGSFWRKAIDCLTLLMSHTGCLIKMFVVLLTHLQMNYEYFWTTLYSWTQAKKSLIDYR